MQKNNFTPELKDKSPPGEKTIKQFILGEKAVRETDNGVEVDFIISTEDTDRDQDLISVDGWDLDNYKQNPVILWAHDSRKPPIAKSINIATEDNKLKSTALFMSREMSSFAYSVGQMYKEGFLNAVSVGFRPLKAKWAPDEESRPYGIDYFKQELLEYSCVPVPANPNALIDAKNFGIDMVPVLDWAVECLETGTIEKELGEKLYKILNDKKIILLDNSSVFPDSPPTKSGIYLYKNQINKNRRQQKC